MHIKIYIPISACGSGGNINTSFDAVLS